MNRLSKSIFGLVLAAGVAIGAHAEDNAAPNFRPGVLKGYLSEGGLPDSSSFLPPPPSIGSAAAALDQDVTRSSFALRDTARWKLAGMDADLTSPDGAGAFACALGAPITAQDTPRLYTLLHRVLADAGQATFKAKDKYLHARPFMLDSQPICSPDAGKSLRDQGSYPSGHASVGWAWALVLTEAAPDRSEQLIARGLSVGQSRIICNVHWESDVIEARTVGAATVARLHAEPEFLADMAAAKAELAAVRKQDLPLHRDCKFEAEALSQTLDDTP